MESGEESKEKKPGGKEYRTLEDHSNGMEEEKWRRG
jgi:hypothetical protein